MYLIWDHIKKKNFTIINKSSFEIVKILNDIIDIINLKNNKLELSRSRTNLSHILDKVVNMKKSDAKKNKSTVSYSIKKSVPTSLMVDELRLKQILDSIVDNAIKHTPNGMVRISVSSKETKNHHYITFKIQDNGSGISDETKKIIDSILGLSSKPSQEIYKYRGFGLLIVNKLCKLMDGKVWYKSELDMGTVFYFKIKCEKYIL